MSEMIPNPENYFRQFIPLRDSLLLEMEQEAFRDDIPIIGPVVGELLSILTKATQARRILELGTATGYSAIFLARACRIFGGRVITLENDAAMADSAAAHFQRAGLDNIEIRVGDALQEMKKLSGPFDLIFMDIDKEHYLSVLPDCHRLMRENGLLVTDNVGFADAGDFNQSIWSNSQWRAVNLFALLPLHSPENDGLCLALRV